MLQILELGGFADKNSKDDMFSIVFLICSESAVLYHNMVRGSVDMHKIPHQLQVNIL